APDPLVKLRLCIRRDDLFVGDQAIDRVVADAAGKAHVMQLHGCGTRGKDAQPTATRMALAIDEYVDVVVANALRNLGVGSIGDIAPVLERGGDASLQCAAIVGTIAVREHLECTSIVRLEQPRHETTGGVLAKLVAEIANAQPLATRM